MLLKQVVQIHTLVYIVLCRYILVTLSSDKDCPHCCQTELVSHVAAKFYCRESSNMSVYRLPFTQVWLLEDMQWNLVAMTKPLSLCSMARVIAYIILKCASLEFYVITPDSFIQCILPWTNSFSYFKGSSFCPHNVKKKSEHRTSFENCLSNAQALSSFLIRNLVVAFLQTLSGGTGMVSFIQLLLASERAIGKYIPRSLQLMFGIKFSQIWNFYAVYYYMLVLHIILERTYIPPPWNISMKPS